METKEYKRTVHGRNVCQLYLLTLNLNGGQAFDHTFLYVLRALRNMQN